MTRPTPIARGLVIAALLALPVRAHDGPPYPIFVDEDLGGWTVSVWTDPDVGTGTFYYYLEAPPGHDVSELRIRAISAPADGSSSEVESESEPAEPGEPFQQVGELPFARRGIWSTRFVLRAGGDEVVGELSWDLDVTPPGLGAIDMLWFALPFLAIAGLWLRGLLAQRAYERAHSTETSKSDMTTARGFLLVLPTLVSAVPATAFQEPTPDHRPAYSFLRQNEDWSQFVPGELRDAFDPIKHIPLSDDGRVWLSLGGSAAVRFESWRSFAFSAVPDREDDSFVVSRLRAHADLHIGDRFRFFVEGKTAQSTERDLPGGRRALDMDTVALQQAFAEWIVPLGESTLTLRPGRQMLLLGAQRLVSPLPWGNTLRTWQGVTGEWRGARWSVTALATAFVPVEKTGFNEVDPDTTLFGLYAKRSSEDPDGVGLEVYALGNERPDVAINGTSGDEERLTIGTRTWGPIASRSDFEVEGGWQTGKVGEEDVSAWSLAAELGWKPESGGGAPRLWLGLDLASGDEEPGGDVETFHQLFPLGHAYLGYIDAIGRQNIVDVSIGGEWAVVSTTKVSLALHDLSLMSTEDALYDAGGAPYRSGFGSSDVGREVDLLVRRSFGRHVAAYAGYSHFFPGDAISETGPAEDIDFAYIGCRATF